MRLLSMYTDQAICQGHPEVGRKKARKEKKRMLFIHGNKAVWGIALEDCMRYVACQCVYIGINKKLPLHTRLSLKRLPSTHEA